MTNLTTDDGLKDYQRTRSPDAFRRLVDRYVDLVYAAARRQVRDAALAEDVTQAVFTILSEKAGTLDPDRPLSAWLLRVTAYAAANARRARARQVHHERKAAEMTAHRTTSEGQTESDWDDWSPLLDEGINRLRPADRDAIVLGYFEQKSSREVAVSLGITEEAAAKRIERAVRKLRDFFARRGATVSAAAIAATLLAHSTEAAPPQLGASIAGSAVAGVGTSVAATSIAKGAIVAMTYAKAKMVLFSAVAGLLLVGGAGVVIVKTVGSPDPAEARTAASAGVPGAPLTQWPVTFSDGSTAELVGITDSPASGQWWAPDGSPIPVPADVPSHENTLPQSPKMHGYRMLVRHTSPALNGTYLGVSIRQNHPAEGNTGQAFGPNVRVISYSVAAPNDLTAADLVIYLSRGPWTVDERYTLPAANAPAAPVPNPTLRLLSFDEENGSLVLTLLPSDNPTPKIPGEDELHVVSSADGREYSYDNASYNPTTGSVYRFPIRKDQAVALVHRWRPYETQELHNISLRPGSKTDVTISK